MRLILVFAVLVSGCAAARSTVHLVAAQQAVQRAETHRAPELAAYEYTMASELLGKAREEAFDAQHHDAIELAREAADWADRATVRCTKTSTAEKPQ
jgi:hypothetical protein